MHQENGKSNHRPGVNSERLQGEIDVEPLDDGLFADSFFIPDEQIPVPTDESWNNLGRHVRSIARQVTLRRPSVVRLPYLALAATLVVSAAIAVLLIGRSGNGVQRESASVGTTEELHDEWMQFEALALQTELDLLSLDFAEMSNSWGAESELELIELIQDIDSASIIDAYIRAL